MNKRIFLVVVLLFALSVMSISVHATGPVCNPFGNTTVCTDVREQPYNSSAPTIKIDFYEAPVDINYIYLVNDKTFSRTSLQEIENIGNEHYKYIPKNYLGDYKYTLVMDALDQDQNEIRMYVNFTVNSSAMDVWVKNPKNKYVQKPDFAFGNETPFFFEIQTERPGECGYSITPFNTSNSISDEFNRSYKFTRNTTNTSLSYKNAFSLNNLFGNYKEGQDKILYVLCLEDGQEKHSLKEFIIGEDTTPPTISLTEDPSIVINPDIRSSFINLTTDDLSVCTINNINAPENGVPITSKHYPGIRFTARENFTRQYDETLNIDPGNPSKYDYLLNVSCDNIANYHSSKVFNLKSDIQNVQDMNFLYPPSVINKTEFDLNISVVIRNDICEYSFNKTGNDFKPLTFANTLSGGGSVFTAKARGVEGKQTIYVNCSLRGGFKEFPLLIDTTGPTAPKISTSDNTCSLNSFKAQFESNDTNGTGVFRYHYNVTYDAATNETSSIAGYTSGSLMKSMDFAKEGGNLIVSAYAIDKAGNAGQSSERTITITNNTIDACDFTAPKIYVNATKDSDTNEWTLIVDCKDNQSGCKGTFDYSVQKNRTCVYDQSANLKDPVSLTNTSIFCAVVYDGNENNATITTEYNVKFPLYCYNKTQDGTETDIDCGGKCGATCDINSTCKTNNDCLDKYCAPDGTCQIPSCSDKIKNGAETGIDCGGTSCSQCAVGKSCVQDDDCTSGNCDNKTCAEASCTDGKLDGSETDVDCGGDCGATCKNDYTCLNNSDCISGYCTDSYKCDINRTVDSDGDELPDYWERDNFGCITCANPNEDSDGDGYTNFEEFKAGTDPNDPKSIPPYHKVKLITIILLVLGGLAIIVGAYLLYAENSKKKKATEQAQQKEYQSIFSDTPEPIIKQQEKPPTQRPLTQKEIELRQQHRALSMKEREEKRRQLFNEFSSQNTTTQKRNPKPPKPVVTKPQTSKPKVQPEKTDEYIDISKLKENKLKDKKNQE